MSPLHHLPSASPGEYDPRLWDKLLGHNAYRQAEAARTIRALELEAVYARHLLNAIPSLPPRQRAVAGDALALLGDPRFSPPYFLPEMIYVPGGTAILGSREYADEQPIHAVQVAGFSLAQYPVTQAAYAVFLQATRHRQPLGWHRWQPPRELSNAPVVFVSLRDAEAYCEWLTRETGIHYRLPTEAEWVLAARGTDSTRIYPWGDVFEDTRANTWGRHPAKRLCAVGMFPEGKGPYGHDDLAGNVWEWCSSLDWPYPYQADDGREGPAPDTEKRVLHGGSWRSRPYAVRCAARQSELPTDSFRVVGFRIARGGSFG